MSLTGNLVRANFKEVLSHPQFQVVNFVQLLQVLKREEAVGKGINFDRVVGELVMKMNRMQVGKRSEQKWINFIHNQKSRGRPQLIRYQHPDFFYCLLSVDCIEKIIKLIHFQMTTLMSS